MTFLNGFGAGNQGEKDAFELNTSPLPYRKSELSAKNRIYSCFFAKTGYNTYKSFILRLALGMNHHVQNRYIKKINNALFIPSSV